MAVVSNFKMSKMMSEIDLEKEFFSKEEIMLKVNLVTVTHGRMCIIIENKDYSVYYQMTPFNKKAKTILLLHGQNFNSQTWFDQSTIQFLTVIGLNAIAIDLPGFGKSFGSTVPSQDYCKFLQELILSFKLKSCIIISPSYSGNFSISLLQKHPELFDAFIAIAPVSTDLIKPEEYEKIKVPTLIIRGSRDLSIGSKAIENLKHIPQSVMFIIPDSGHACYLDNTDLFHKIVHNFLGYLKHT